MIFLLRDSEDRERVLRTTSMLKMLAANCNAGTNLIDLGAARRERAWRRAEAAPRSELARIVREATDAALQASSAASDARARGDHAGAAVLADGAAQPSSSLARRSPVSKTASAISRESSRTANATEPERTPPAFRETST